MAGVRTSLTEAQIESRRNHYLEKIGQGKPKAKGTKSNPLKMKIWQECSKPVLVKMVKQKM